MLTIRFAAAFWTVYAALALRPSFSVPELRDMWRHFPELTTAALASGMLPAVVAAASIARWLRARPSEQRAAFAAATRIAALLSIVGLLLPFHAAELGDPAAALGTRCGQLVALLLMLDGPLVAEAPETFSAG